MSKSSYRQVYRLAYSGITIFSMHACMHAGAGVSKEYPKYDSVLSSCNAMRLDLAMTSAAPLFDSSLIII